MRCQTPQLVEILRDKSWVAGKQIVLPKLNGFTQHALQLTINANFNAGLNTVEVVKRDAVFFKSRERFFNGTLNLVKVTARIGNSGDIELPR